MTTIRWRYLYEAAMLELDPVELRSKIEIAEEAIRRRGMELTQTSGPSTREEQKALADALGNLRILAKLESKKLEVAPMRKSYQPAVYEEAL